MIDKILKAASSMKKHKQHARHVFNYLEKYHGITVTFSDNTMGGDTDSVSKKSDTSTRKSSSTTGGHAMFGKMSNISRTSETPHESGKQRSSVP
jgi:hypothetical protein